MRAQQDVEGCISSLGNKPLGLGAFLGHFSCHLPPHSGVFCMPSPIWYPCWLQDLLIYPLSGLWTSTEGFLQEIDSYKGT